MRLPYRWQTVATFAVTCFMGGIATTLGVHEAKVEEAIAEAREQAKVLDERRRDLESTLTRAQRAAVGATSVEAEQPVAVAARELSQATVSAELAAQAHSVVVDPEPLVAPTLKTATEVAEEDAARPGRVFVAADDAAPIAADATAEPEITEAADVSADLADLPEIVSPSPVASASASATSEVAEVETPAAEILDDEHMVQVLEGEVGDLETVRAAVARLEEAVAEIDEVAYEVESSATALEDATSQAQLDLAVSDMETGLGKVQSAVKGARQMANLVEGKVAKDATVDNLREAATTYKQVANEDVDTEDAAAVSAHTVALNAAHSELIEARQAVRTSHTKWVKQENARRAQVNKARTQEYQQQLKAARAKLTSAYRSAVSANQNGWEGSPQGISYSNGQLPASELCEVSFAAGHQLQCDAADALEAANDAYKAQTGRNLKLSSSYRSYAAQVATRASKGGLAATPGTSNHGWGMAVDFESASASWLRANGADYGWVHPTWARPGGSKPEWWHLEFVAPGVSDALPDQPALLTKVSNLLQG